MALPAYVQRKPQRPAMKCSASLVFLVIAVVGNADRKSDCRAECHLLRSRLDPSRECKGEIRGASTRGKSHSAGNACLKSFIEAFQDECHRACMSHPDTLQADSAMSEFPGNCPNEEQQACRKGYEAGIRQTRRFFGAVEPTSNVTNEPLRGSVQKTLEPQSPIATLSEESVASKGEAIAVNYRGQSTLVHVRQGQKIEEAAASWCRIHDASPMCPRILLMILEQGGSFQALQQQ